MSDGPSRGAGPRERVLLTFTGFHDPFAQGAVAGKEEEGPILSLLRAHPVERVVLFSTPKTDELTLATQREVQLRYPRTAIDLRRLELRDPTDYFEILAGLRSHFGDLSRPLGDAVYYVATASGTPQMHACWVLLVASGEIPARLLHVRPPRFVTRDQPVVSEVDLDQPDFPTIRAQAWGKVRVAGEDLKSTRALLESLGIAGDHPDFVRALETAAALARTDVPVLVLGESGTGKEKIAEFVHHLSARRHGPLIAVNCAAIPVDLAESELFGHRKGAFTGATVAQEGKFAAAHGGTLFLDEVGELPPAVQAKLLRAVQNREIVPLGETRGRKIDTRLVAATNRDLKDAVKRGAFRRDLYHRLNVGEVGLPPLRVRRSDISKLALLFLDQVNQRLRRPCVILPEALGLLLQHDWPGNVRELANVVERAAILCRDGRIGPGDLRLEGAGGGEVDLLHGDLPAGFSLPGHLEKIRDRLFERALQESGQNQKVAARLLGISPQAVNKFLKARGRSR